VLVRGFDKDTAEEAVLDHFSTCGIIVAHENVKKSMMVLTYDSKAEAEDAVATLHKSVIEGNERYVEVMIDNGPIEKKERERPDRKRRKTNENAGDKKEKGPSGPDLPRERITVEAIVGKVVSFRGKSGWLIPTEKFDHPDMKKHKGKIWAHVQDVISGELNKDDEVQFHLFKDSSGIGAEEIVLTDAV